MPPAPTTNIGVVITFWPSDGGSTAGAFSATCETSDPAMIKEQLSLSRVNACLIIIHFSNRRGMKITAFISTLL